jgi:hypothetical protein
LTFITLKPTTIKAILQKNTNLYSACFQRDAANAGTHRARRGHAASAQFTPAWAQNPANHEEVVIHFEFS